MQEIELVEGERSAEILALWLANVCRTCSQPPYGPIIRCKGCTCR